MQQLLQLQIRRNRRCEVMKFLKAELDIIDLYDEDIITLSGDDGIIGDGEPGELPRV